MPSSQSLPLQAPHVAFGGVIVERDGRPRVASYGEPGGEYAAGRERSGLVDLHERGVLDATGPKRQELLQRLLSNEVASLQPGQGRRAALLSVRGTVQALVRVLVEADVVALETDAARLEGVQRTLEHYRVAAPVRFVVRPTAVLAVIGPEASDVLRAAGAEAPLLEAESHARETIAGQRVRVARASDLPGGGLVVHVAPAAAAAVWQALHFAGARPIGRDALDALRIEALRPWSPGDVGEDHLLHETGLVAECHSPSKGCYLGQEVVARLEGRGGNVNKALRGLELTAPASAGDPITSDGKDVGRVTTGAVSPRLGPIALGYVHRSANAAGTAVLVNGAPATVVTEFAD